MRENATRVIWKHWIVLDKIFLLFFGSRLPVGSSRIQKGTRVRLNLVIMIGHYNIFPSDAKLGGCTSDSRDIVGENGKFIILAL